MIEELQAAALVLITATHLYFVLHCREWRRERMQFAAWADSRTEATIQYAADLQEAIEDIVDSLSNNSPASKQTATPLSMLTELFISKAMMSDEHGSTAQPVRQILETQQDSQTEETENESGVGSDIVSGG